MEGRRAGSYGKDPGLVFVVHLPAARFLLHRRIGEGLVQAVRRILVVIGLWVAYVVLFIGGVTVLGPTIDASALTPAEQAASVPMLLLMAAIDVVVLAAWLPRARFGGWRLWLATAVVLYGVKTFMSQIEAWYFVTSAHLPPAMIPHLFAMTLPVSLLWPALAVWALGPREAPPVAPAALVRHPTGAPVARFALAGAVLYPALFFLFGYYVAWQNPAVRVYYEGPAVPLPIAQHFTQMWVSDPLLVPFEMVRGLLWVAIGWPVLKYTRGPWWEGALFYATMMALLQNDVHLLPNVLMPGEVRLWHFIETASSNFLFALGAAALLSRGGAQAREDRVHQPVEVQTPLGDRGR